MRRGQKGASPRTTPRTIQHNHKFTLQYITLNRQYFAKYDILIASNSYSYPTTYLRFVRPESQQKSPSLGDYENRGWAIIIIISDKRNFVHNFDASPVCCVAPSTHLGLKQQQRRHLIAAREHPYQRALQYAHAHLPCQGSPSS